ncbi:Amidase [Lutibaculum baratangense AMV1]|uniref:Amidase n=1 Tax=Lutibaculum baratangense AMV1 TaxID=631454 RepID=V4QYR5_9HYPH|nr:Amidase [Lutibaculum baratangense AMV1]
MLDRIGRLNPVYNAYVHLDETAALRLADESHARFAQGEPLGSLDGIPFGVKDLIDVAGMPTRRGSLATDAAPATRDAPAVARLREQGAIPIGKTATSEFGWQCVTDSPLSGMTRNPRNPAWTAGGSSGGAAVAAALGLAPLHVGTDGAGSIRIPASFCGVFGFKPTYGRVAHAPAAHTGSLFHAGPIARTPRDAALLFDAIARPDARDWQALPRSPGESFRMGRGPSLSGARVAVLVSLDGTPVAPEIAAAVGDAAQRLEALGAQVDRLDPMIDGDIDAFRVLWCAGAFKLWRRLDERARAAVGPGLARIAEAGSRVTVAELQDAEDARGALANRFQALHARYPLLLLPTLPILPFDNEAGPPDAGREAFGAEWSPFTFPFNMTQQPAASLPLGASPDGRPIGIQLVGPKHADASVLRAAHLLFEAAAAADHATRAEPASA